MPRKIKEFSIVFDIFRIAYGCSGLRFPRGLHDPASNRTGCCPLERRHGRGE